MKTLWLIIFSAGFVTQACHAMHISDSKDILMWHEEDPKNYPLMFTQPNEKEVANQKWKLFMKKIEHEDEDVIINQSLDLLDIKKDTLCALLWQQEIATSQLKQKSCYIWIRTSAFNTISAQLRDYCNMTLVLKSAGQETEH